MFLIKTAKFWGDFAVFFCLHIYINTITKKEINMNLKTGVSCKSSSNCEEECQSIFSIKKNDTRPSFRVSVEDCEDFDWEDENLVLKYNMWFKAKLKNDIIKTDNVIYFADNLGFDKIIENDIIFLETNRRQEQMLVLGIDESNKSIQVQRSYNSTSEEDWKKGSDLKIFRVLEQDAEIEVLLEDVTQTDGTILENQISDVFFVVNWDVDSTKTSGCYFLEFKLKKINSSNILEWSKTIPNSNCFVINIES